MGRAGRAAPRTCSTLELRSHASSLTVSLPPTVSKPVPVSPPSPSTPVQAAPASLKPLQQAWPQDALQVVQRQLEALRSHSMEASEPSSRKRGLERSDSQETVETPQTDGSRGFEVELQAQPALPEDWEQFLDLKTGQFYYFHWSSCKRAKQDPRELIRRADECVQAHLLLAHTRGDSSSDNAESTGSQDNEDDVCSQAGSCPPDVCERTNAVCSAAPDRCADRSLAVRVQCVEAESKSKLQKFARETQTTRPSW